MECHKTHAKNTYLGTRPSTLAVGIIRNTYAIVITSIAFFCAYA